MGFNFTHECFILDADCTINLASSGVFSEILGSIPCKCHVSRHVDEEEVLRDDLQICKDAGLLTVAEPQGIEYEILLSIVSETKLGDGESETAAIAVNRNWAIAIDDRSARNYIGRKFPQIQIISTPDLLKHWVEVLKPVRNQIATALQNVRKNGRYSPGVNHALYGWWERQL